MKYSKIALLIVIILIANMLGTAYAQEDADTYKVALLLFGTPEAINDKMAEYGYVEGENITYLYQTTIGNMGTEEATYEEQIQAMIDAGVDVFVVETDTDAVNLRNLIGDSIPIVFARADDPVATGAVADLVSPGGNTTGTITNRPHERRLQLLAEIKPTTKTVYYIISTFARGTDATLQQVQAIADDLDIDIVPLEVDMIPDGYTVEPDDWEELIQNLPEDTDWIFFTPWVFMDEEELAELMTLTVEHQIGLSFITSDPVQGYIISYGPSVYDSTAQAALHIDRILQGVSPADLPVQTAENYLTINLEAAETIGLEIPESVLRQANLIIRPGYFDEQADSGQ